MTTLHLSKENFKFSAAHFLIFDDQHAEKLHGHNYQVKVEIPIPEDIHWQTQGFFIDFSDFKKMIKSRLDEWDEHVLLPIKHQDIKIRQEGASLHLNFRDRYYVFPQNEVICLPITNTSVEQLSYLLAVDFLNLFQRYGVREVRVEVEETRGQSASTQVVR